MKNSATRAGRNGGRLNTGNPGNRGGTGRPPKAFKNFLGELQRNPEVQHQFEQALLDRTDKNWGAAWGILTRFGPIDEGQAPLMTDDQAKQVLTEALVEISAAKRARRVAGK